MPTRPLSDELAREAWETFAAHEHNARLAADALGLPYETLRSRIKTARARGFGRDPAIQAGMDAVGTKLVPALAWAKTKNEDGTSYSVLLKPGQDTPESLAERLQDALAGIDAAQVIPAPDYALDGLLTVYPLADVHMGMMAWGKETGEDYDTAIAANRVRSWVSRAVDASPASETAVILGLGDLTHADDQSNMTPRSKHVLDVDTRHFRTLDVTIQALAYGIEYAAKKHTRVIVRILPGNHDLNTYMAVMFALYERYRDNPRIEVQKIPGEFFVMRHGNCLLAAHHGHGGKPERMVMFLADEHAAEWGRTRHRFLWTGHLHHLKAADIGGVQWMQLRAITAKDAYAAGNAYGARASLEAITFDADQGEIQRVRVSA
jgi:hypothetical protein